MTLAREIGDRRGEGAGLCNLGSAYGNLGETRLAIESLNKHYSFIAGLVTAEVKAVT